MGGWIAGFLYATAVNVINLSSTPQSDMPIAGFLACAVLGLVIWFDRTRADKDGAFSMIFVVFLAGSLALAAVMKASALLALAALAPALLLLAFRLIIPMESRIVKKLIGLAFVGAFVTITIFLCGGYYSNYLNFGHPQGSEEWRAQHELTNVTISERFLEGSKNLARYLTHFLSFDGFYTGPPGLKNSPVREVQKALSDGVRSGFETIGWNLEEAKYSRVPFRHFTEWPPKPISNADLSYPGIVFLMALGMTLLIWWKHRQSVPLNPLALVMVCGAVLYLCLQSFLALYDPWRGRSFSNLVVMLAPVCGILSYASGRFWKSALACLLVLGTVQGTSAILFRDSGPLIALKEGQSTIFSPGDRASQYSRFLEIISPPKAYELQIALRNYFWLLPKTPKLAITIQGGDLVYPFIYDAEQVDYYKSADEIPIDEYDAALVTQPVKRSKNIVNLGQNLFLLRKENSFPERAEDEFDAFFGIEKSTGIGDVEVPYAKIGRAFRIMSQADAELEFQPIVENSKFVLEVASIETPNSIHISLNNEPIGDIPLTKKGEARKIAIDVTSQDNKKLVIRLKADRGYHDQNQNRVIYAFIFKALLIPSDHQSEAGN